MAELESMKVSVKLPFVGVEGTWTPDERVLAPIRRLSVEDLEELLWEIRFQLLNMRLRFSGVSADFDCLRVSTTVYLEDLSRNEFADALGRVRDSLEAMMWCVARRVGLTGPAFESLDVN